MLIGIILRRSRKRLRLGILNIASRYSFGFRSEDASEDASENTHLCKYLFYKLLPVITF